MPYPGSAWVRNPDQRPVQERKGKGCPDQVPLSPARSDLVEGERKGRYPDQKTLPPLPQLCLVYNIIRMKGCF